MPYHIWHDSTLRNSSLLRDMCDMSHPYMWHDSLCMAWLIIGDGTYSRRLTYDSSIQVTWPIACNVTYSQEIWTCSVTWLTHTCDISHSMWHDSLCVTELILSDMTHYTWQNSRNLDVLHDVTHLCMWHYWFYVTWLIHTRDRTHSTWHVHSYTWQNSFYVTWLIIYATELILCDMTRSLWHVHSYVWQNSFYVTWLVHCMWHVHSHVRQNSFYVTSLVLCDMFTHMCDRTYSMCDRTHFMWHDLF